MATTAVSTGPAVYRADGSADADAIRQDRQERLEALRDENRIQYGTTTSDEQREEIKQSLQFCLHFFSGTDVTIAPPHPADEQLLKEAFVEARDLVLNAQGHIDASADVTDFSIDFHLSVAKYTNPVTGKLLVVDLLSMEDHQEAIDLFFDLAHEITGINTKGKFAPHSKGLLDGAEPLDRSEQAIASAIPASFDACARGNIANGLAGSRPEDRPVLAHRLIFAELLYQKFSAKIDELIADRENSLTDKALNIPFPHKRRLQQEKEELEAIRQKLQNLDVYALSVALLTYPTSDENFEAQIAERSQEIERGILSQALQLDPKKQGAEERAKVAYARDVAALLHTTRWQYQAFCEERKMEMKAQGTEDVFLQEALAYGDGEPGKYLIPALCGHLSEELQGEIDDLFDGGEDFSLPLIQAADLNLDGVAPADANAPAEQAAEVNKRRSGIASRQFAAIRAHIAPPPPPPAPAAPIPAAPPLPAPAAPASS
jgi:hypothetical protein